MKIIEGDQTPKVGDRTIENLRTLWLYPEDHRLWCYAPFTRAEVEDEIRRRAGDHVGP